MNAALRYRSRHWRRNSSRTGVLIISISTTFTSPSLLRMSILVTVTRLSGGAMMAKSTSVGALGLRRRPSLIPFDREYPVARDLARNGRTRRRRLG